MEKKIKIYKDCKELPFWNYKRIMQTGDFFLLVKGYDSGDDLFDDEVTAGEKLKELELAFNAMVEDYAISMNLKSEEILEYGNMLAANNEINKLSVIVTLIDLLQRTTIIRQKENIPESPDFNMGTIKSLLVNIKIEKSDDLEKQKQILETKILKHKNQLEKSKSKIEKQEINEEIGDFDIDKQYWSVCLGLEMHVDPKLISLYEYGVMVQEVMNKVDAINKMNHGR